MLQWRGEANASGAGCIPDPDESSLLFWLDATLATQRAALAQQLEDQHAAVISEVKMRFEQCLLTKSTHEGAQACALPMMQPNTLMNFLQCPASDDSTAVSSNEASIDVSFGSLPAHPVVKQQDWQLGQETEAESAAEAIQLQQAPIPAMPVPAKPTVAPATSTHLIDAYTEQASIQQGAAEMEESKTAIVERPKLKRGKTQSAQHDQPNTNVLFMMGWGEKSPPSEKMERSKTTTTMLLGAKKFQQVVSSSSFDAFFGILIFLNSLSIMAELEYEGHKTMLVLGLIEPGSAVWSRSPETDAAFQALSVTFAALFIIELTLRLLAVGPKYLRDLGNWIDVTLVVSSILELVNVKIAFDLTFLRLLRVAKLVRLLKVVRTMKFFESLRILVKAVAASFGALFWSVVLLTGIEIMAALFMVEMLSDLILDENMDKEIRLFAFQYYGTTLRALLTMFEITMAPGAWSTVGRPLIEHVSPLYGLFFVGYVGGVTFAIIRIITALFLRHVMSIATSDETLMCNEKVHQQRKYTESVRQVFAHGDTTGDGKIDFYEFHALLQDPKMKAWLSVLELEVSEAEAIFQLLDNGDGALTLDEFLAGVFRLKGNAKQVDVVTILYENQKINKGICYLQHMLEKLLPKA